MIKDFGKKKEMRIVLVLVIILSALLLGAAKYRQNNCDQELLGMYMEESPRILQTSNLSMLLTNRYFLLKENEDSESINQARSNAELSNQLQLNNIQTEAQIREKIKDCDKYNIINLFFEVFQSVAASLGFVTLLWD